MVLPPAVVTVPPVAEKLGAAPDFLPNPNPLLPKPSLANKGAIF
jgi:hypothetical protein